VKNSGQPPAEIIAQTFAAKTTPYRSFGQVPQKNAPHTSAKKAIVLLPPLRTSALPWAAVAVPPPGRDGLFVAQEGLALSSEAASRRLPLLLPPRPGALTAGPPNSVWAGGRATQGGGGPAVGTVEETSDPFAPHRVAAFSARGGGAAVPEPRQVAGIRPRTARAIEARATRAEKKARRRQPQVWHCKTCKVDCSSAKIILAHKASSGHYRKAAEPAGTRHRWTCDKTFESAGHLATHMQSRHHAATAVRMNLKK